jgi:hypothetical protein
VDKIDQFKIKNQDLAESFMPGRDKVFGAILGAAKQHAEQKGKRDQLRSLLEGGTMAAMDTGKVEMRKAPGAKKAEEALSTAADFIPFVGAGKSAMQGDYGSAALQAGMDVAGGSLLKGAAALGGKAIPALAGIFIGPKSKLWDKAAADEFNRLVDEGEDWNKAHGKTGTHFGADSALRQEISDKNMRLRSQAELDAMAQQKRIELSALESAMRFNKTGQRDLFPRELSAARAELRPRRLELETDIDLLRADPSRTGYPLRLVMEHPELYKAYPNIGDDVMVRRGNDLGKGVYGEVVMGPSGRTIGLSRLSESPNAKIKPEDTMVHELQHVIQDIEGFEGGSSPRDALNLVAGARIRELQAQGMSPKDATAEASKEFSGRAGELYSRMAGEAEARAVEARRQMTPEERLSTYPQDQDYDNYVPYDRQLMQRDYQPYAHGGEVHMADAGSVRKAIQAISKFSAPQDEALRVAQRNAVKMLGLPPGNTPMDRARAMKLIDAYHGTKQDITGGFKPGYDDNLAFVTKSPEFASQWIGKGKLQQRSGEQAQREIKSANDAYKNIRSRNMNYEALNDLKGEEFNSAFDRMNALARAEAEAEFGLLGIPSKIHSTVYPLKVMANKTFNPETDMDVMAEFFEKNEIPPKLQDLYASGNYMMYETKPVVSYLQSKGYDSMRLRESTGDDYPTIAVFNPKGIRSRFAAFDPARQDENDLLAGIGALGLGLPLASGLANRDEGYARGGDVHMARGGDAVKALIKAAKALDLPPAAASQRTQIPGTEPTYRKAKEILDREMPGGRTLDYGSGLGIGSRVLGSESFEPFPREGVAPTYTRAEDIPSDAFHRLVNLNMLNVVPRDVRDAAVENIGRVMRPGGMGLVTTRGKDVMKASGELGPEPNSMITSIGTYQKGFTPEELREYLQYILGNKYDIGRLNLGPAGAVVRKKGMKEGGEVHMAGGGNKSLGEMVDELPAKASDKIIELALQAYGGLRNRGSLPANQKVFLDTFVDKNQAPITESMFSEPELNALKAMISRKGGDKGSINYNDYASFMNTNQVSGNKGVLEAGKNPYESLRTTLGQFNYRLDPATKKYVVEDTYDFNRLQKPPASGGKTTEDVLKMSDYIAQPEVFNPGNMNPYMALRLYAGRNMPEGQGRPVSISVPYAKGGEVHAANGLPLTFAYDKEDPDALQNWMRESQFGKVDIPAPYRVKPEEVTVARAMRTPAPEMSAKDKLRTLLQEGVKQGKKEIKTLGDPNAVTDLVNRGLIANNPVSGAIDLVNMGLEPFGLGSEMPIGGSAHVQKLMKDYGFTKQERPLLETGLALASPFMPAAAKKVGQLAKDTAPAAREALHGALESGMESGLIQGPAYAIKPVGGQWLDAPRGNRLGLGNESLAESKTALDRALERAQFGIPEWQELVAAGKFPAHIAEGNINAIRQNLEMAKQSHALNSFTEKQLTNYIRNQMGSPEDPILKLAENWPNERAAMLAERRQRLGALEAKRQAIETNPVPADVRDPAAWRQARIRTIEGEMAGVRKSIDNIIEHQPLHMPTSEVGLLTDTATRREKAGFPAHGTATTDIGRGWENLTDRQIKNIEAWKLASSDYLPSLYDADAANLSASIFNKPRPHNLTPQQIQEVRMYRNDPLAQPEFLQENKWLGKLDPGTPIYGLNEPQRVMRSLGFDHVMDVLQSDLRAGRIKPEQLNRMSVEDAVRRTAEYNAEKAAAMSKAEATSAANLTPHRDYPGGYRMVQLDKPGQFAKESQLMGHSVEGYEPPPGHPDWVDESLDVGSKLYGATKEGWEGLKSGQTQVFSFRDSKNRPHATLEIKKPGPTYQEMKKIIDGYDMDENAKMDRLFQLGYVDEAGNVLPDKPNEIVQIKGKVNNLVNEDYWPYLQRYVRESGMPVWSDDLNKIGLIDMRGRKLAYTSNPDKVKNIPDYITESERQRLRSAGEFIPDPHFSSPEFAPKGMKRGGRVKLGALSLAH